MFKVYQGSSHSSQVSWKSGDLRVFEKVMFPKMSGYYLMFQSTCKLKYLLIKKNSTFKVGYERIHLF